METLFGGNAPKTPDKFLNRWLTSITTETYILHKLNKRNPSLRKLQHLGISISREEYRKCHIIKRVINLFSSEYKDLSTLKNYISPWPPASENISLILINPHIDLKIGRQSYNITVIQTLGSRANYQNFSALLEKRVALYCRQTICIAHHETI